MVTTLLNTDSCVGIGTGLATTWTLSGLTYQHRGTSEAVSDGYKIVATFSWVDTATYTSTETISGVASVMGTCVETLDSAGIRVSSNVTDDGNNAICHWFYVNGGAISTPGTSTGTAYAETTYYTYDQWGTTSGSNVIGSTVKTVGTTIGTTYDHTLNPNVVSTEYAVGSYTMTWYQPKYAATYKTTELRRYSGGESDADKVRAYCVSMRILSNTGALNPTGIVAADKAGTAGVVTL